MKKLNSPILPIFFLFVTILLLANTSCSETVTELEDIEEVAVTAIDTLSIAHTVGMTIDTEKTDSLNRKKCVYLTIDDGPLNGSYHIDSIVSSEKVKTNLFLVGNSVDGSGRFLKYHQKLQENPYIEIYNHSYSHANNRYSDYYKSAENVFEDFEKNQSKLNIHHKIARLPGRNLWQIGESKKNHKQTGATSAQLLADNGYKVFGWDVEWKYDPKDYSPKQTIEELIKEIETIYNSSRTFVAGHVVILMHDQMFNKIKDNNNLGELIGKLKESGFSFEYLSSYPESDR